MMVTMVKVGESKYDNYGRITCSIKIAELLELEKGEDVVEWHIIDGNVVLRKRTKTYQGFDLESQDIRQRLIEYEEEHLDELPDHRRLSADIPAGGFRAPYPPRDA